MLIVKTRKHLCGRRLETAAGWEKFAARPVKLRAKAEKSTADLQKFAARLEKTGAGGDENAAVVSEFAAAIGKMEAEVLEFAAAEDELRAAVRKARQSLRKIRQRRSETDSREKNSRAVALLRFSVRLLNVPNFLMAYGMHFSKVANERQAFL